MIVSFLFNGCVSYTVLETATSGSLNSTLEREQCEISYTLKMDRYRWSKGKQELEVLPEFYNSPYGDDYIDWTNTIIEDIGCKAKYTDDIDNADFNMTVTDDFPYGSGAGQGEGILGMLTLYIIPIPLESPHRSYKFTSGDTSKNIKVINKGWLGIIFIPALPMNFYPFEKNIFKSQLREYLLGEKT